MAPLRVGIVGSGVIAEKRHIPAWRRISAARLQAICDVNAERAEKISNKYGISKYFTNFENMLEHENLDIIDVCTPTLTHYEIMNDAILHNNVLIVEKPITSSSSTCKEIIRKAMQNNVKITVCHTQRFYSTMIDLHQRIKANDFGSIKRMDIAIPVSFDELNNWVTSQGGPLWECVTHAIYISLHLMGDVEKVDVIMHDAKKPQENLDITLHAKKGLVSIRLMNAVGRNRMELYSEKAKIYYPMWPFNSAVIEKTCDGWWQIYRQQQANNLKLTLSQTKQCIRRVLCPSNADPHTLIFKQFVDSIRNYCQVPVPPEEGLKTLEILEEIERSIKSST